ncbi:hypothetical protein N9L68_08160, partial [bacterium]|nr:hypothetical protein [bacterium]
MFRDCANHLLDLKMINAGTGKPVRAPLAHGTSCYWEADHGANASTPHGYYYCPPRSGVLPVPLKQISSIFV